MVTMGPHSSERWGVWHCDLLSKPIILGVYMDMKQPGQEHCPVACYRSLLCEKEDRDCWLARPTESERIPFVFDDAVEALLCSGKAFPFGLSASEFIADSRLPREDKITLLREFVEHQDDLQAVARDSREELLQKLREMEG